MRSTTKATIGSVALVMMLVLGALSVASASASEFLYTGPLSGKILFLSDNTQTLTVEPGGVGTINCKHFGGEVGVPATKMNSLTVKVTGAYHECKIAATGGVANVSAIEYEISADGLVNVLKSISISVPSANCTIKVHSGTEGNGSNKALEKVVFLNNANGTLLLHSEVTGIHTLTEGGNKICGAEHKENTEGAYIGLVHVFSDSGGTVSWDK